MIYLDSAATTLLKPPSVAKAVEKAIRTCASPGRGVHPPAMRAADCAYACREEAMRLFGLDAPERVTFTMNATHGLNIAVRSLVQPGMRVVISGYEHNAVVRPLVNVGARLDVCVGERFNPDSFLSELKEKIPGAGAVVCTHVSNVFGFRLPVEEVGALCRENGVPLVIDAAQSAGHVPVDFSALGAEFVAVPGHKGLMGPQGTGLLLCRNSAQPLLYGGTGNMSDSTAMPEDLPERLEAGTQNVCGIAGLREGIRFVRETGVSRIAGREAELTQRLHRGLKLIPDLNVISVPEKHRTGVISVIPLSMSGEDLAAALGEAGVAVRAGLHCAPLAHKTAGTVSTGTVRYSVCAFNTPEEMEKAVRITEKILKNRYKT